MNIKNCVLMTLFMGLLGLGLVLVNVGVSNAEDTDETVSVSEYTIKENAFTVSSTGMLDLVDAENVLRKQGLIETYHVPKADLEAKKRRLAEEAKLKALQESLKDASESDKDVVTRYTKGATNGAIYLGVFSCTAYCNCIKCCGKYSPEAGGKGTTYTGTIPVEGRTVAVDPHVIPLGSKLLINGNVYIAEDIGSAINGNDIDIYFGAHSRTYDWGRRNCKVWLLKKGSK